MTNLKYGLYTKDDKVYKGGNVAKVKDADIKKLSITKREFVVALKKVSQRIEKSKSSSK